MTESEQLAIATGMDQETLSLRVVQKQQLTPDIVLLTLGSSAGGMLPPWEAGAHISLMLASDLERQYSLCGTPDDPNWKVAVRREPESRGGSALIHTALQIGDHVPARPPRNNFALAEAQRYIFIAGGIGITPILPMVRTIAAMGLPWVLHYAVRRATEVPFSSELQGLKGGEFIVHARDRGERATLSEIVADATAGTQVYACGPESMMAELEELASNLKPGILQLERFAAKEEIHADGEDLPFTVRMQQSGGTVVVGSDESILDALRRAGVFVRSSCREGVCGTCETAVLSGEIDHRDSILTPDEREAGDYMMICVSRAQGDMLELDV